jgi:hypothetical protein
MVFENHLTKFKVYLEGVSSLKARSVFFKKRRFWKSKKESRRREYPGTWMKSKGGKI